MMIIENAEKCVDAKPRIEVVDAGEASFRATPLLNPGIPREVVEVEMMFRWR
jgi:hypothetical protein